jgi:hypothetical protein
MAAAVVSAFALPFGAQASALGDNLVLAQGGGDTGASSRQPGVNGKLSRGEYNAVSRAGAGGGTK